MVFVNPKKVLLQSGIAPGMVVADFGSGSGAYAQEALHLVGSDGMVYAIDIQQALVNRLKKEAGSLGKNLIALCADLTTEKGSTLTDSSVDVVIVSNILFQTTRQKQILQEAYRILRSRGRLVIVEWQLSTEYIGPHHEHHVSEALIKDTATSIGFTYEMNLDTGQYHYGCVMRKNVE